ncbi:2-amino-4-oxopentanoate thiolase subunit OrtA [Fundicoccus culcitae]|uniref:2-amino-4-oxopentanoate thiolase subunit OrtA n=1 Tax=Fundicoccus culcitae TaxID=2969821 RepID=A0ABY5P442_9LACT|nr:2-amino-4-oxopentanoate thiolase subunit OrtA [Fundicoccus culcitae]UUX33502.1 2-amino-4-oxopentanoate thiolase subunit OrtA [Fundicoccus culcitae]
MVKKGEWVQISAVVLTAEQRAAQVPEDTKATPLIMWVKGYLLEEEAEVGQEVMIETVTKRRVGGTLVQVNPVYTHSFGRYIPEITQIHQLLADALEGGAENDG